MENNLFRKSLDLVKKNLVSLIFLSVFFSLMMCACLALDYLVPGIGLALILFVMIPCFFGAIIQSYALKFNPELKMGNYFKYSYSYYRVQFYGSFHLIISFLKALLVELVSLMLFGTILFYVYQNVYGADFLDAFESFYNYVQVGMDDINYLNQILEMHNGILDNFLSVSAAISSGFGVLTFVFAVSYRAVEVLFRHLVRPTNVVFAKKAISDSLKLNRRKIFKDFIKVNWPIYVLGTVGYIAGSLISYFAFNSYDLLITLGIAGLFIFIIPYLPIYLSSLQCLYEKYQITVVYGIQSTLKKMLERLINNPGLSEEQKEEANRILEEAMKEDSEEGNKKDPESGS